MPIRSDFPITDESQDLFSRKPLADILVKAIREYTSHSTHCITIGIYGEWGEGKTSVMNMVRSRLELLKYKDRLLISSYNPWLIKDQESMLVDFFRTIMGAGFSRRLFTYFKQYGNLISYIAGQASEKVAPLSGGTISAIVGKLINGLPGSDISLTDCKKRISAQLKKERRHLIVFIDDLDRLDNNEIHTVFRLIKQVADFENVIYLVAMDDHRVSKALCPEESYGERFVDKIIQIQVRLPKLQRADLHCELRRVLIQLKKELGVQEEKLDVELVSAGILEMIRNERDITRYYNLLLMVLPSVKNELNLNDFCLLQFLDLYKSEVYETIFKKKTELLRLNSPDLYVDALDSDKIEEKKQKRFEKTIGDLNDRYGSAVANFVQRMFPKRYANRAETIYDRIRINNSEYFDRYFIRNYQVGSIPYSEVSALLSVVLSASREVIASTINRWLEISDPSKTFDALMDVIVGDDKSNGVQAKRVNKIVSALLVSNAPDKLHFDQFEGGQYASRLVAWMSLYMFEVDANGRRKNLDEEINDTLAVVFQEADLYFCMEFLVSYHRSFGELMKQEVFSVLRERVISSGDEHAYEELIKFGSTAIQVFFIIWNQLDKITMHETMQTWLDNKEFRSEAFIRRFIGSGNVLINDLDLFVSLFDSEVETYMQHLVNRLGPAGIKDEYYRLVLANWRMSLESHKNTFELL